MRRLTIPMICLGLGAIVATGTSVIPASALAAGPDGANRTARLWTERPLAKALNADDPVSMSAFSKLARELSPAVVNINTTSRGDSRMGLRQPFQSRRGPSRGLGSGFIIRSDGYVLTNNHVVESADEITVRLSNEHEYEAKVVGTYPPLDIALLKFTPREPLTAAPLGNSARTQIGEWVVAIGNPFGLNHTVTAGIVSAKGRRDVIGRGGPMYARFIQTDASINPGNSGGPLINIAGEVIGINTAINAAGQGIGFAVPVDMVKKVLPQLATGTVNRSYLGVHVGPVSKLLARRLNMDSTKGALVAEVVDGTPASKARLRAGDVITHWNGRAIDDWEELPWLASTAGDGVTVEVTVNRSRRIVHVKVTLRGYPERGVVSAGPTGGSPEGATATELGVVVSGLSDAKRSEMGIEGRVGVEVERVAEGSLAARIGLRPGDIITHVNYEVIASSPKAFRRAIDAASGELLMFSVRRGDRFIFLQFSR